MLNGKQRSNHHTNSCPVCASQNLLKVMELEQMPVLCNVLWKERDNAISVPRGDIHLYFCKNCTHLFNTAFNPEKLVYNESYENSLVLSPLFQKYAHWLAGYLISRYDLHGKTIIEIGSGKGDF